MKKYISILLASILAVGVPFSVSAASAPTGGSFTVTYNVQSSYLINLPDITLSDETRSYEITADYVHIAPGKSLLVLVDAERTFNDDGFYLYKNGGTELSTAIPCEIKVDNISTDGTDAYTPYTLSGTSLDKQIAHFRAESTEPEGYGRLTFNPQVSTNNSYGSYTGTIYYTFLIQ